MLVERSTSTYLHLVSGGDCSLAAMGPTTKLDTADYLQCLVYSASIGGCRDAGRYDC